jgi:hypothetical protein
LFFAGLLLQSRIDDKYVIKRLVASFGFASRILWAVKPDQIGINHFWLLIRRTAGWLSGETSPGPICPLRII